jgi:hypothetical protein
MNRIKLSLCCFFPLICQLSLAQSADEKIIRELSALEVESFLKSDTAALEKLWSPNYVVMNPFNKIVTVKKN